jgi:hypothetical protein
VIPHPVISARGNSCMSSWKVADFNHNLNMSTNVSKTPKIEYHENPISRSRVSCVWTDRRTDRAVLINALYG